MNRLRIFLNLAAIAALLLPIGLRAQQTDQSQSQSRSDDKVQSQAQSNDSSAQPEHTRRARGMRRRGQGMAWLAKKLNLSEDQKQQFRSIRRESMKQAKAIRTDSSLTDDQKRDKIKELRKQQHRQMFSLLTPEQKDQLKQLREQRRKQMQQKAAGAGDQASAKAPSSKRTEDDDPFAGMTSDDDNGPGNGGF